MSNREDLREFIENHPVGFCHLPDDIARMPTLAVTPEFQAPAHIDLRDYCTQTENQGKTTWCAAYAAANWAENILWRKNDYIRQIDPAPIYKWAKANDGLDGAPGTTLTAALQALTALGYFDPTVCHVKIIKPNRLSFKYAIHKFGCILAGFNISSSWWSVRKDCPIIEHKGKLNQGGHAVIVPGYTKDGIYIANSWGKEWGEWGFAKMSWHAFDKQVLTGAVLDNCLNGLTINA